MVKHNQHVVPHEGKWAVRLEGSAQPSSVHATQEEAIHRAREIAHRMGVALIIHEQHGRIEHREKFTKEPNQHVVPHEGKWAVKAEGSEKPASVHETQHDAIQHAREIAKKQETILFIHA